MAQPYEERDPIVSWDSPSTTDPQVSSLTGGNLPVETPDEREARIAYGQFREIGGGRRFMAGARNMASATPFIGRTSFANPETGTQEREDLDLYRTGMPRHSGIGRLIGGTAPYVAAAGVAPALFSTLPRAMLALGGTEAADTAFGGGTPEDITLSGARGAASAVPGWLLGRTITPIPNPRTRARLTGAAGRTTGFHGLDDLIHGTVSDAARRRAQEFTARTALGTVGGQLLLDHPILGAILGNMAPRVSDAFAQGTRKLTDPLVNATIDRVVPHSMRYLTNRVLSPENQAILTALSGGALSEAFSSDPPSYDPSITATGR